MINKVMMWARPDGGVSITHVQEAMQDGETEDQFFQRIEDKLRHDASVLTPEEQKSCISIQPDWVMTLVDKDSLPDRTFRDAWKAGIDCVEHDNEKCKDIAHQRRRAKREEEFKPHDEVIAKQIPGKDAAAAEAARAAIRQKYEAMQVAIDSANSVADIKAALA